jgi:hypothetical protein
MKFIKISIYIYCVSLATITLRAQNKDTIKYALKSVTSNFSIPTIASVDPYLSPLMYRGIGIQYNRTTDKYLKPDRNQVSFHTRGYALAGFLENSNGNAFNTYVSYNYGWGYLYHYRPYSNFQLLIGGVWDYEFGYKNNSRNVNNIFNVDLSSNINLAIGLKYNIITPRRIMRVSLTFETPIFGYMFVPLGGASYYEILLMGDFSNTSHFSHLLNRQGYRQNFGFEIPLKYMTWRLGLNTYSVIYKANDMVFSNKISGISLGASFDIATFTGRVKTPPNHFINSNN